MRRLKPLSIALAGLALSAVATAEAGWPTGPNGQPATQRRACLPKTKKAHLCANCAERLKAQGPIPATGGCPTGGPPPPPPMVITRAATYSGSAPGYAVIGDGTPSPMMMASGPDASGAPGYAIVGGTIASSEPAPVGVVRTNYNTNDSQAGSLGGSVDIMHGQRHGMGGGGMGMDPRMGGNIPYAKASEMPGSIYSPNPPKRRSLLGRIIGVPDFGRRNAEMEERKRESHAMTTFGPGSAPTELPSSMVYGGGAR